MKTTASECPEHNVTRIEDAGGREYCPQCVRAEPLAVWVHLTNVLPILRRVLDNDRSEYVTTEEHRLVEAAEEFIEEALVGV